MAFVLSTTRSLFTPRLRLLPRVCPTECPTLRPSQLPNRSPAALPSRPLTTTTMLSEGSPAPDFERIDGDGNRIKLSELRGQNVVLYFSNLAGPGCTSQSCSFRDAAEDFSTLDARIIAISAQGDAKSAEFKRSNRLPFPVISDSGKELQKLYGVPSTFGLLPGRVTFVIDKKGVLNKVFNSQFNISQHISTAKEALKALK